MSDRLIPCTACGRHVRVRDEVCPFCATSTSAAASRLVARPSASAATSTAIVAAALALAGCAGAAADSPAGDAAPPPVGDAGDAGAAADAQTDAGTFVAMYGAPGCDVAPSPARGGFEAELASLAALGLVVARRRRRDQA